MIDLRGRAGKKDEHHPSSRSTATLKALVKNEEYRPATR